MTTENPGALPLPRPTKAEMQVVAALEGGTTTGLKDADGIRLSGLGYLVRTNRSLRPNFVVIFGNAEEAYRFGTIAPHSIRHLLPQLETFNPKPPKQQEPQRSEAERQRSIRELLRRSGSIVLGKNLAGQSIDVPD